MMNKKISQKRMCEDVPRLWLLIKKSKGFVDGVKKLIRLLMLNL